MINIIIPVLNEESILKEREDYYKTLNRQARVIFVDGGSKDRTVAIARNYGEVVCCESGRGPQKNRGVEVLMEEPKSEAILLFLHVDTVIDPCVTQQIEEVLESGVVGGCLTLKIDNNNWIFTVFANIVNWRARHLGIVDGDLGLFIKKDVFDALGKFDPLPFMEDILFSKKLRKKGLIKMLPQQITVSSRKWEEQGFVRTFFRYTVAYFGLLLTWKMRLNHP